MADNEFDVQDKETRQYISVKIGEEKFGIDIGYVVQQRDFMIYLRHR